MGTDLTDFLNLQTAILAVCNVMNEASCVLQAVDATEPTHKEGLYAASCGCNRTYPQGGTKT